MESNNSKPPEVEINELPANSLVTREELDKFKDLARKEYGVDLTDAQAFEQATALLLLFDTVIETTLVSRKKRVNIDTSF
ncbi:hypothetical protein A3C29_03625 [Candidatus Daviesbacteria bacterium RIFCSPHIGHO2_02_FULL_40_16]|nr:MAG: hypothetical protein UT99_C0026G0001 [Candidatus Curtissbacteria bacterium GW2011_GWA2_40_31]KKU34541.1 MAG: hypothetical protein UX50_C0018G0001 [Candidatus Beckwithbacteria bacterium GW2011_GWA1_46_30]OGE29231.1 MAG: hypothetical protein A3C29_03625 [Candidatus Daviesbacteria bacterium RIFCSPHIGHO2_02_FULL_40_16]